MPVYFDKETEKAIILYNKTECKDKRNEIYKKHIEYAFNKLVENIIHSFKLHSKTEDFQTLRDKTTGDLVLKLNKFNPKRKSKFGNKAKAFSFFGTVAKNFIMTEWKRDIKMSPLEDLEEQSEKESHLKTPAIILEKFSTRDTKLDQEEFKRVIIDFLQKEQKKSELTIDVKILDAIECAFDKQFDITNKKALFLFLREFTGLTTPEISSFLSKFRPKIKNHMQKYLQGEL